MGRGVRSNDDYCVVLLLGPKLISRLRSPDGMSMLTPATCAQLDLSRSIAKRLTAPSISEILEVILQCLNRDPHWIRFSKQVLVNLKADDELRLDPAKLAIRAAFDYARANEHSEALVVLQKAIDAAADELQVNAWLLSKKATFQHPMDPDGAQRTLAAAHRLEPMATKPMHGITYKKLTRTTGQQAETLISIHNSRFVDPTEMKLFVNGLCDDLQFIPESSHKFEAAIDDLAWFIGFSGQRPERDYGEGPDNLWALPNGSFLVIECKSGVTSEGGISKTDAGQLGQSDAWFKTRYPASTSVPIIIHKNRTLHQGASPVEGMRVIDSSKLEKLRNNLRNFAQQLFNSDVAKSASEVASRLRHFELNASAFVNAFSIPVRY